MRSALTALCLLLACLPISACGAREDRGTAAQAAPPAAPASVAEASPAPPATAAAWEAEVAAWKKARFERLQRPDGWLTLVGLAWLEEGDNPVGSDPQSTVLLPAGKAPARLGILKVSAGPERRVTFVAEPGLEAGGGVTSGGAPVATLELVDDSQGDPTLLEHGSLSFFAIRRAGRLGVRVKDSQAQALREFKGLDYFPVDAAWRIEGEFEPAAEVREVPIPNALGFDEPIKSPGHVRFRFEGQEYRLLALDDTGDGRLFLVFGDKTNGRETYGGGRFLYTDPPRDGSVVLDFNRAYNPPCVFTPYATCPLPPRENRLPFRIAAGERSFAGHEAKP
jgi:uncharacterized protein (DUF1684 family)